MLPAGPPGGRTTSVERTLMGGLGAVPAAAPPGSSHRWALSSQHPRPQPPVQPEGEGGPWGSSLHWALFSELAVADSAG